MYTNKCGRMLSMATRLSMAKRKKTMTQCNCPLIGKWMKYGTDSISTILLYDGANKKD